MIYFDFRKWFNFSNILNNVIVFFRNSSNIFKTVQSSQTSSGESNPKESFIVGGTFPEHCLVPARQGRPEPEHLAQVHACVLLKRIDERGGGFIVQHLPRKKVVNAQGELEDLSDQLQACITANHGRPPIAVATDCHLSYDMCQCLLLGLLPRSDFNDLPVLKDLKLGAAQLKAPCFVFKHMVLSREDYPIYGTSDPKHIIKAISRALRT